jgi:NAD+ kinase
MNVQSVLVVYKRSAYEVYCEEERNPRILHLVAGQHFTVHDLLRSHQEHREAMERVGRALEELHISYRFVRRAEPHDTVPHDLLITVGGDGTFLEASHYVRDKPMLGVNSSPSQSVGIFCGATAKTFKGILADVLADRLKPLSLNRLGLLLNGNAIVEPVLNEALICAQNPAITARYVVEIGRKKEHHKSSGLYVGPAAGSTAVIRSAGGQVLPLTSRKVQYVVREPYRGPGNKLTLLRGMVPARGGFKVYSKMHNGIVYIDGAHVRYRFDFGDEIQVQTELLPLQVYAIDARRGR